MGVTAGNLRLIVMRHGEAQTIIGEGDHGRNLTSRGVAQAAAVGKLLDAQGWVPGEALVSAATRTRQTYEQVSAAFAAKPEVRILESLYLADSEVALTELASCSRSTVLLVGHNPGWSDLVENLSGRRVALMPSETALLTIVENSWSEAIHMAGVWHCHQFLRG